MMPIMRAELSAQPQIGAVLEQRRLDEFLRRAAALIRADVDVDRSTLVVPPSRRLPEHLAVQTSRRSDAG
jgi:hypothetical protein